MEIPKHIQELYRHLEHHTKVPQEKKQVSAILKDNELFQEIEWFINERITLWEKKTKGMQEPFTEDPILATYRFCNIYRELDKQTIIFHTLLNPLRNNFPLWLLNMFYCRMVARPETITFTGLLSFDEKENNEVYKKLLDSPRPRYGTPYIFPISTIMKSNTPTRELFIAKHLPNVMEKITKEILTWDKVSVYDGVERILPLFTFNHSFLWTEVLIDVAYQYPEYIDLFSKFPVGPGSMPSMKRISTKHEPSSLVEDLAKLAIATSITVNQKPLYLSAENWEGIGCEFRKYTNLKNGKGRKRIYSKQRK